MPVSYLLGRIQHDASDLWASTAGTLGRRERRNVSSRLHLDSSELILACHLVSRKQLDTHHYRLTTPI